MSKYNYFSADETKTAINAIVTPKDKTALYKDFSLWLVSTFNKEEINDLQAYVKAILGVCEALGEVNLHTFIEVLTLGMGKLMNLTDNEVVVSDEYIAIDRTFKVINDTIGNIVESNFKGLVIYVALFLSCIYGAYEKFKTNQGGVSTSTSYSCIQSDEQDLI